MTINRVLSPDLKKIFDIVESEVIWLHTKWIIYSQLFGKDKQRVDLLNESASVFFSVIQDTLLNDTIISIGRLIDNPKALGQDNASIEQLIDTIDEKEHTNLCESLRNKLKALRDQAQPIKLWRNKLIAHTDLRTALVITENPLPGISRDYLSQVLLLIREIMNTINVYYFEKETGYEYTWLIQDGEQLIYLLEIAKKYEDIESEK